MLKNLKRSTATSPLFRSWDSNVASTPWALPSVSPARPVLLTAEIHHHDFQYHGLLFIFLCIMSVRIIKSNPCTFYTRLLWSDIFVRGVHPCWLVRQYFDYTHISLYPMCLRFYVGVSSCSSLCVYISWCQNFLILDFFFSFGIFAIIVLVCDYSPCLSILYFWDPLASMFVFFNLSHLFLLYFASFIYLCLVFIFQSGYYLWCIFHFASCLFYCS